jgi:hypothetical protein
MKNSAGPLQRRKLKQKKDPAVDRTRQSGEQLDLTSPNTGHAAEENKRLSGETPPGERRTAAKKNSGNRRNWGTLASSEISKSSSGKKIRPALSGGNTENGSWNLRGKTRTKKSQRQNQDSRDVRAELGARSLEQENRFGMQNGKSEIHWCGWRTKKELASGKIKAYAAGRSQTHEARSMARNLTTSSCNTKIGGGNGLRQEPNRLRPEKQYCTEIQWNNFFIEIQNRIITDFRHRSLIWLL